MERSTTRIRLASLAVVLFTLFVFAVRPVRAPQETAFTYQGQLTKAGTPADGDYNLQLALFDDDGGGTQIGETQTLPAVVVSNGLFTVDLNFGVSPLTGENRFLEISALPARVAEGTRRLDLRKSNSNRSPV
jgi:hypothetical protein